MRRIGMLAWVGLLAGVLALGQPAAAGAGQQAPAIYDLSDVPYQEDAYAGGRPLAPPPWDRAVGLDLALASMMINAVFFPFKLALGVVGAEVGVLAGAMNGGDIEAAAGVWNVTTDGSYYITPEDLDGRGEVRWGGDFR